MLIPYSTDAPVYHFPFVTIGLITLNVLAFAATIGSLEHFEFLMLEFDTINPLQWLTTNFLHLGLFHLLGNMFFLWGFGLVIEGKLGPVRFGLLYLGMAIVYGAIVQLTMFVLFNADGKALGASGVIFALLGIAVLWAPKNEMNCILLLGVFSRTLSISILSFGGFYIAMQVLFFVMSGFSMSSEALHLAGLSVGLPVGFAFLKKNLVDCEGWDYFTLFHSSHEEQKFRQSKRRRDRAAAKVKSDRKDETSRLSQLDQSLTGAVESGNQQVIVAMYRKFIHEFDEGIRLPAKTAMGLASALQRAGDWEASIPILAKMLQKYPASKTTTLRLNLAQVLIQRTGSPKQALAVMKKIDRERLNAKQVQLFNRLVKAARSRIANGSVEFDIQDW